MFKSPPRTSTTGTVTNFGDGDARVVSVEAEFFDALCIRLDTGLDYIGDLRAGQSSYFDVSYYEKQCPNDYEIWAEWLEY